MTEPKPSITSTEFDIPGANCPWCLNETLDALRAEAGVVSAEASISDQCLRVEHRGVDTARLVAVIGDHLRADEMASAEHVMLPVAPHPADTCQRHAAHPGG